MSGTPEKLWLSAPDADGEHEIWFDPEEGGTPYLRADLAADGLDVRVGRIIAANAIGGSETYDCYASLSRLIATRLLGVKPDEQDLEIDDHDWQLIIDALSHKAFTLAEMNGDETAALPDIFVALKLSYQHLLGSDPEVTSGGVKNSDLREIIASSLAKAGAI